jgi:uncharacterized protein YndB with AHSA1/START domain
LILGALAVLLLTIAGVGLVLPVAHTATRQATLGASPERVFEALTRVEQYPHWRSDVQSVELLSTQPMTRWREIGGNGTITFEFTEVQPPARLVARIADPSLPFGGSWTYVLSRSTSGTGVTITENGEVYNPLFRFMSRFVFGHTATLETFLKDLEQHMR